MKDISGQMIPQVTFVTRQGNDFVHVTSEELFRGKTVVVFSLPGAFTPTCSSTHLPRYNQLAPALFEKGVDDVICISVNDGFVMESWGKDQESENVRLLPDGNGEFTEGMGALVDKSAIGFGPRSWRYSMVVEDGKIVKMFIEDENSDEADPFSVSDADTMFEYIAPSDSKPQSATLLTREGCAFCSEVKDILAENGLDYEELILNRDIKEATVRALSGSATVPQLFVDGELIGDSQSVKQYFYK